MTDNKIEDAMVYSACDTKRKVGYDYICGHTSNIDVGTPDNHWRDRRGAAPINRRRAMAGKPETKECIYCGTETEGYVEAGRGEHLLKFPCCENCYIALLEPLSDAQKRAMAEAAHALIMANERCNFEE